jgi:sorting nexin-8
MPTPRKQQSRADLLRSLLAGTDVPDSYIEAFDHALRADGSGGKVSSAGVSKVLAAAKLDADDQARIANIIAPGGDGSDLGRDAFNVLLALIGLAQEGEGVSLDGVDDRRRSKLPFCATSETHSCCPIFIRSNDVQSTYDESLSQPVLSCASIASGSLTLFAPRPVSFVLLTKNHNRPSSTPVIKHTKEAHPTHFRRFRACCQTSSSSRNA